MECFAVQYWLGFDKSVKLCWQADLNFIKLLCCCCCCCYLFVYLLVLAFFTFVVCFFFLFAVHKCIKSTQKGAFLEATVSHHVHSQQGIIASFWMAVQSLLSHNCWLTGEGVGDLRVERIEILLHAWLYAACVKCSGIDMSPCLSTLSQWYASSLAVILVWPSLKRLYEWVPWICVRILFPLARVVFH